MQQKERQQWYSPNCFHPQDVLAFPAVTICEVLYYPYPAALVCNPLCDFLCHNEAANETDNLWEEAANTSLQHGHRHAIAEAQQRDDAAPADVALTEKPDTSKALMCCKPCKNNYFSTRILTGVSKFKDCRHWKDLVHEGPTPQAGYI